MKAFISVFALTARSALPKCIGATALTIALETGLFLYKMDAAGQSMRAEDILGHYSFSLLAFAGLLVVTLLLSDPFSGRGSCCRYTLNRLSVSPKTASVACSLFSFCMLLFFLAAQTAAFWLFCRAYAAQTQSSDAIHAVFLAFTRCPLIMAAAPVFMPLHVLKNILMLAVLSLASGWSAVFQKNGLSLFLTIVALQFWLNSGHHPDMVFCLLLCCAFLVLLIARLAKYRLPEDDSDGADRDESVFQTAEGGESHA